MLVQQRPVLDPAVAVDPQQLLLLRLEEVDRPAARVALRLPAREARREAVARVAENELGAQAEGSSFAVEACESTPGRLDCSRSRIAGSRRRGRRRGRRGSRS